MSVVAWALRMGKSMQKIKEEAGMGQTMSKDLNSTEVLARIPDVDAMETIPISTARLTSIGKRLLSEGLSAKLLLASGVVLLLIAIVPFLFSKKEADKPGNENTTALQGDTAKLPSIPSHPTSKTPARGDALVQTEKAKTLESIKPPESKHQLAQSPPAGDIRGEAGQKKPSVEVNRPMTTGEANTAAPVAELNRQEPRAGVNQPAAVGDPAGYRNNLATGLTDRRIDPPSPAPFDRVQQTVLSEPGVARLDGIIEAYPVRTTNDRTRPSIY
jgi:hypothetical protein